MNDSTKPSCGEYTDRFSDVQDKESEYLSDKRNNTGYFYKDDSSVPVNSGLALSGGGIRSATFSLGVLQCLAHNNVLKKFDYLSTVSGGGYIGSSLSWFLSDSVTEKYKKQFGTDKETFPYDTEYGSNEVPAEDDSQYADDHDAQKKRLLYLRQNGNYLTPGNKISGLSLFAVILRAIICNLLVWVPLLIGSALLLGGVLSYALNVDPSLKSDLDELMCYIKLVFLCFLALFSILFVLVCIVYSLLTKSLRNQKRLFFVRKYKTLKSRYLLRRKFDQNIPKLLVLLILSGVAYGISYLHGYLYEASMSGAAVVLFGLLGKAGSSKLKLPLSLLGPMLAFLSVFLVVIASTFSAEWLLVYLYDKYSAMHHAFPVLEQTDIVVLSVCLIFFVFSFVIGWFVNVNYISVHRYYRDRLMELFLPDDDKSENNVPTPSELADKLRLSKLLSVNDTDKRQPYHIINTYAILLDSDNLKTSARGGDNFTLSPFYCGSTELGWLGTAKYMGDSMTLPTAMAISGAAANPHGTPGGEGMLKNRWIAFAMAFFNLRLGYWAYNPRNEVNNKKIKRPPNHFSPGLAELSSLIFRNGLDEDGKFVQISDGGHFENLGLYELFRRQCQLIMVCDGAADKEYSFADLQVALRRGHEDFDLTITSNSIEQLVPVEDEYSRYPANTAFANRGFAIIKFDYKDGKSGVLIYLKTTMFKDIDFLTKGYKSSHADFPDETTADQFFDEKQFEAYRRLGYAICSQMLKEPENQKILNLS